MGKIDKEVKLQIKILEKRFTAKGRNEEYEKASMLFDSLIAKGLAKKRGNNLLSASDAHVKQHFKFNNS